MSLVTLRHPVPSFTNAPRKFDGDAIVYDPRLFVMTPSLVRFHSSSVSELLAYRFATFIGMPLLPFTGFWCPDPVFERRGMSEPGRIGLAISWRNNPTVSYGWCNRAGRHPNTVAKALVLSLLKGSGDLSMVLTHKQRLVAFNLGGLFPDFQSDCSHPRWREHEEWEMADLAEEEFRSHSKRTVISVMEDAERYGVLPRVAAILERVLESPFETLRDCFDISPHPLAEEISIAAMDAVSERLEALAALA